MSALALALLLVAAAEGPAPTPAATPTPTPRPATATPRTLQELARERRLATKGKGSLGTITLGPSTSSPAPAGTPAPEAAATPAATPEPELAVSAASVRVSSVTNDGIVDPSGGVRVHGTIKNGGYKPACSVVIAIRILDSRGQYLASGQATPDVGVLQPGETVSFHAVVQAPPGVRGARTSPDRKDTSEGSTTMGGDWKLLGGTEASIANATEDCVK